MKIEVISTKPDKVNDRAKHRSNIHGGSGKINITSIKIMPSAKPKSPRISVDFKSDHWIGPPATTCVGCG